ncbi:MAG: DUF4153 domain-containing protein [Candidatus Peribacteria bacterium]|nr:DUF4153 domain-containing protein [Candidatus Peribacteria bacterium]
MGIFALLFVAPYLTKITIKNSLYYQYVLRITQIFLFGIILGGLLFGLGALAVLSLEMLFDIGGSFLNDVMSNWAIIALSFITPLICLMKLPQDTSTEEKVFTLNTFEIIIIKYVLTSFVCLYFIILYGYTIKVLTHFSQRPTGEVCWLVIAFSIVGYLRYLLSSHLETDVKWLQRLRKRFPLVVIPQIFMLFYAIGLRIQQYDVTIDRYFVVGFGIWLLLLSLYFFFAQQKRLVVLPASLVLFTLLISF